MKKHSWITNGFIDRELYGPFIVKEDSDFYENLKKRYSTFKAAALRADADGDSIKIIERYTTNVLASIRKYYHGQITDSQRIIRNLIKDCLDHTLAVSPLAKCEAFGVIKNQEIQFFRARVKSSEACLYAYDMLHLPSYRRCKAKSERFSIPGVPGFYLSNSSYGCWLELGQPADEKFWVSPCILDGNLRVLNLAVMNRDMHALNDCEENSVHCWLKLLILMIATSYRIEEDERNFCSEYIIPQNIMMACKELGLDGVIYYSNRTEDHIFAQAAINAAFFVEYRTIYTQKSKISQKAKIGNPTNYNNYKQLSKDAKTAEYNLKCLNTGIYPAVGNYDNYDKYSNTEFCKFDKYIFANWLDKD